MFGVSTATVGLWAHTGELAFSTTPGGHRRYCRIEVAALWRRRNSPQVQAPEPVFADDAVRLYDQGWSIRQVAGKFDMNYSSMRRLLKRHTTLRR